MTRLAKPLALREIKAGIGPSSLLASPVDDGKWLYGQALARVLRKIICQRAVVPTAPASDLLEAERPGAVWSERQTTYRASLFRMRDSPPEPRGIQLSGNVAWKGHPWPTRIEVQRNMKRHR